jgi:hypothetical protein
MTREELIESFATGYKRFKAALKELPRDANHFKPSEAAWSIHEIIIHMPDSEASGFIRFRKIIAQSGVTVDVYDQDDWTNNLQCSRRDSQGALALFKQMRKSTTELVRLADESVWGNNYVNHPEDGKLTLEKCLEMYADHVDAHIGQMQRNVEAWEKAGRP